MVSKIERKQRKKLRKQARKQLPLSKKIIRYVGLAVVMIAVIIILLASVGTVAHAAGLVDETINAGNAYSQYAMNHYQLDFYVDNSWGWLPWNWIDGLGKSVMYGIYAITNFIWTISLYLSNATGYLVQEAYRLDFISQTSDAIGRNIQTLAGITPHGFSSSGFYVGFLLFLIFIMGVYVTYIGLIKRETTKAVHAVLNFVVIFLLSASFIAYAPSYIDKINDFSKDVSNASLDVGTKIVMPGSEASGRDSVDMIRDSLFSIQVKQPWLLLQFGTTEIAESRVEDLLSISPDTNNGEDRETAVKEEIEQQKNTNLTITKAISRLGTVFFLFLFNIGISVFVFLLTGMMIFSQVLFIIFATFLPVSFLLSMIPGFEGMAKKAITKLFNVIMTRAGITLIITVAFSISAMLYSLAGESPFFMIMFLQIVTFAGIYAKLGELMNMFALQSNDSQKMSRQIFHRPRTFLHRQARRLQRSMSKTLSRKPIPLTKPTTKGSAARTTKAHHERSNTAGNVIATTDRPTQKSLVSKQLGAKAGTMLDTKNRMVDKVIDVKDQLKGVPTNARYAVHKGKRNLIHSAGDFSQSLSDTRKQKQQERSNNRNRRRTSLAQKRLEMEKTKQKRETTEPYASIQKWKTEQKTHRQPVPKTTTTISPKIKQQPLKESASHHQNQHRKATLAHLKKRAITKGHKK